MELLRAAMESPGRPSHGREGGPTGVCSNVCHRALDSAVVVVPACFTKNAKGR